MSFCNEISNPSMMMSGVLGLVLLPWLNCSTLMGSEEFPRMLRLGRLLGLLPLMLSMEKLIDASTFFNVCNRLAPRYCFSWSLVTDDTEPV